MTQPRLCFDAIFDTHHLIMDAILREELERQNTDIFEVAERGSDRLFFVNNLPVVSMTFTKGIPTIHCHDRTPEDFFNC